MVVSPHSTTKLESAVQILATLDATPALDQLLFALRQILAPQQTSLASFLPTLSTLFASSTGIQELYCSRPQDESHPVMGAVEALLHHIVNIGIPYAHSREESAPGADGSRLGQEETDRGQLEAKAWEELLLSILRSIYIHLDELPSSPAAPEAKELNYLYRARVGNSLYEQLVEVALMREISTLRPEILYCVYDILSESISKHSANKSLLRTLFPSTRIAPIISLLHDRLAAKELLELAYRLMPLPSAFASDETREWIEGLFKDELFGIGAKNLRKQFTGIKATDFHEEAAELLDSLCLKSLSRAQAFTSPKIVLPSREYTAAEDEGTVNIWIGSDIVNALVQEEDDDGVEMRFYFLLSSVESVKLEREGDHLQITFQLDEPPLLGFQRLAASETAVTFQLKADADGMRILKKTLLDRAKRYPNLDSSKSSNSTSKGSRKISQAAPIAGPYLLASDSGSSIGSTTTIFPSRLPSTVDPSTTSTIILSATAITATEASANSNDHRKGKENYSQRRAEVVAAGIATSSRSGSGGSSSSNLGEAVRIQRTSGRTPRQMQDKMATKTPLEPVNSKLVKKKVEEENREEEEEEQEEEKSPSQNLTVAPAVNKIARTKSIVIVIASDSDSELSSIEEMSESEQDVRKASVRVNSKLERKFSGVKRTSKKIDFVQEEEDIEEEIDSQESEPVIAKQRNGKAGKKVAAQSKVTRKSTEKLARVIVPASDAEVSQDTPGIRTTRARAAEILKAPLQTANIGSKRKVVGSEAKKSIPRASSTQVTDSAPDLTESIDAPQILPRKRQRLSDPSPVDPAGASGTSLLETQPSFRAHTLESKKKVVSPKRTYGKKKEQAKTMPIVEMGAQGAGIKRTNGNGRSTLQKRVQDTRKHAHKGSDIENVEELGEEERALNGVADKSAENLRKVEVVNKTENKKKTTTKADKPQKANNLKAKKISPPSRSLSPRHVDSDQIQTEDVHYTTFEDWNDDAHFILPSPEPHYRMEVDPALFADHNGPLDVILSRSLTPILDPALDTTFVDRALGNLAVGTRGASDQNAAVEESVSPLIMGHGLPKTGILSLGMEVEHVIDQVQGYETSTSDGYLRNDLEASVEVAQTERGKFVHKQVEPAQLPPIQDVAPISERRDLPAQKLPVATSARLDESSQVEASVGGALSGMIPQPVALPSRARSVVDQHTQVPAIPSAAPLRPADLRNSTATRYVHAASTSRARPSDPLHLEQPPAKIVSNIPTISRSAKPANRRPNQKIDTSDDREAGRMDPEQGKGLDPLDSEDILEGALSDIVAILVAQSRSRSQAQQQLFEDSIFTVNTKAYHLLSSIHEQTSNIVESVRELQQEQRDFVGEVRQQVEVLSRRGRATLKL